MIELVTIPCLSDNYAFLLHDSVARQTVLIDAPEAAPILAELSARQWSLDEVWLTHHHWDHVEGLPDLIKGTGAMVVGAKPDAHRLPTLDRKVEGGDVFSFAGHQVTVLDVSGHTVGHIAYYVPDADAVFTGDSLMALGCGRLFEGTPDQMWPSLSRLAALPDQTLVCSGHEYTASNAAFAVTIEPDNPALKQRHADILEARENGKATVPSLLSLEKDTNPFLRPHVPAIRAHLKMENATDTQVFAEIRRLKDNF